MTPHYIGNKYVDVMEERSTRANRAVRAGRVLHVARTRSRWENLIQMSKRMSTARRDATRRDAMCARYTLIVYVVLVR